MIDEPVERLLAKAARAICSARLLLEAGDADGACNRAYYGMFDAARAAVRVAAPQMGAQGRTHNGLIAAFGQTLVKPGLIAKEFGQMLNRAEKLRLLADYRGDPLETDDVAPIVHAAEAFLAAIRQLIDPPRI